MAGTVVEDHSGVPLASAEVRISRSGAAGLAADLETNAAGRFRAPDLAGGEYHLEVTKPNYVSASLRVRQPGAATLLIRLVRCGVISGQVTDLEQHPIRGASIFAMVSEAEGKPFRPFGSQLAQVDDHGQYRLYNLPPGRYAIAVSYGASTLSVGSSGSTAVNPRVGSGVRFYPDNARPQFFSISGGEDFRGVDFTIAPAALFSVSGRVEPPESKGEFWLALASPEQPALAVAVTIAKTDGQFQFEGIPPGSYHLFASGPAEGWGRGALLGAEPFFGRMHVDVGGQNVENISVAVQKGRSAAFILRAASSSAGACPPSTRLTLQPLEDWAAMLKRSVEVTFAKEQIVDNLPPAVYHVAVSQLGACYTLSDNVIDLSHETAPGPIEILVAPAGSIHGRLTRSAAQASEYAVVLLAADGPDDKQAIQIAFPDAESRFQFAGLRSGRYRIAARPVEERARWSADPGQMFEIDVPGGAPTELEIPAPPAKDNP